ncbi:MAG TPA: HEAT repeat domain-containing protein, partial [Planctomycetota bacterium]|nr:HEAT repeat domain-containing protein [Planctomycetota bacterium]
MLNTRSNPGAGLARLAMLVLALGGGLAAQETPAAPAPAPAVEPATPPAATETQAASDARTTVQAGEADVAVLATAAAQLLALGDYDSLRTVLAGERRAAALALLQALAMQPPASVEPLLDDLLDLATRAASDEVGVAADAVIALLAATRPPSADALLAELRQPDRSSGRRAAILRALGSSGNLALSGVLIEALDTPQAPTARAALRRLTGHDLGPDAGAADWRAFFERNAGLSRDRLLESALSSERASFEMQRQVLVAEVIKVRIASLGTDDPVRLVEGLADEYPGVRLEASKRLAAFRSQEHVALVVPAILRQLGYAPAGENGGAAAPAPASAPDAPAVEADPLVRAALLETLGAVGRQREDVRLALQAELRGGDERVAAAAAGALCGVHEQPAVVGPLLDYLDRRPPPTNAEEVLKAIAANQPDGALERLQPWLAKDQPEGVRAAAVRAVVACDAIDAALDLLSRLDAEGETQKVRWAMAVALGDRLPGLKPDQPAHAQAVLLLARQLDAAEPNVRGEAVTALGHAGTPEVLPLLEKRAAVETDLAVQRCIIVSLGTLRLPEGGGLIGRILSRSKE